MCVGINFNCLLDGGHFITKMSQNLSFKSRGGTPYNGLYGEAPPERGTFFRLQVSGAVMLGKKVTYFGEFGYLNSSCIRKSSILMFFSSLRDKFTLLRQNSVTDVFVDFQPPCWCPCRWLPAWRLHTNLYKFG